MSPSLTFDQIYFEDGLLWKPRYPSLIDYSVAPASLQIDPGFQILSGAVGLTVELNFGLDPNGPFEFVDAADGRVKVWSFDFPGNDQPAGVVENQLLDAKTCRLAWKPAAAHREEESRRFPGARRDLTVLRIFCRNPSEPSEDACAAVLGGLYVAIVNKPKPKLSMKPIRGSDPLPVNSNTIYVTEIDERGRPKYNIFRLDPAGVPAELELEPAFRALEDETLELDLTLALPPNLRFRSRDGEVLVSSLNTYRPLQLQRNDASADARTCHIRWHQGTGRSVCVVGSPEAGKGFCNEGKATAFFFRLEAAGNLDPDQAAGVAQLDIDPTVIQPPKCIPAEPEPICLPPGHAVYSRRESA